MSAVNSSSFRSSAICFRNFPFESILSSSVFASSRPSSERVTYSLSRMSGIMRSVIDIMDPIFDRFASIFAALASKVFLRAKSMSFRITYDVGPVI